MARARGVVTAVVAALVGTAGAAWAGPPRVAVLPLVVAGDDADARALRAAFLALAARQPIAMTSVFDVEDALAGTAAGACAADDKCLTRLCAGTRSPYALSAVVSREEGRYQLAARVVSARGSVVRQVELASTDAGAAATPLLALEQLFERLSLATIEGAPRAADAPVAVAPTAPPPSAVPAPPPEAIVAPARPGGRFGLRTAAWAAAGVAVATGGAGAALALTNAQEAARLRRSMAGGLLPAPLLDAAVALDERTTTATALCVAAGVAAAASAVMFSISSDATTVSLAPTPDGATVVLSGRFP